MLSSRSSHSMATISSFANGIRAKPGNYWARRPSQRLNFSMERKFSASEVYSQNSASTPALEYRNHHQPPKEIDRRSKFQAPYIQMNPPRSFEELHCERTYLLSSLQHEDHKATEILKKLPLLEISLRSPASRSSHRKTKRQLGWLRHRLSETTKQEKSILARLGQLSWEIQSRGRLVQIECERREMERLMDSHSNSWNPPNSGLDARSTEFQPSGYYGWPPQQQYYAGDSFFAQTRPSLFFGQTATNPQSNGAFINQISFELPVPDVQLEKIPQEDEAPVRNTFNRSSSLSVERHPKSITQDRRMSLPTLSNEGVQVSKPLEQELGYFVQGS